MPKSGDDDDDATCPEPLSYAPSSFRLAILAGLGSRNVTNSDHSAAPAGNSNSNAATENPSLPSTFRIPSSVLPAGVPRCIALCKCTHAHTHACTHTNTRAHAHAHAHAKEPYAEPTIRKDKTLVEILDRLKTLEGKIDNLSAHGSVFTSEQGSVTGNPLVQTPGPLGDGSSGLGASISSAYTSLPLPEALHATDESSMYKHSSSVRAMLAWPAVQELLKFVLPMKLEPDEPGVDQNSISILLGLHQSPALPRAGSVDPSASILEPQTLHNPSGTPRVANNLTWDTIQTLSTAFFETFNLLHPIVDRGNFTTVTLPAVVAAGFDDSIEATLSHLVFALGEVALLGTQGPPLRFHNSRPSGVRGGTKTQPPGLIFFNEARRRMGYNLTDCSLENVQVYALVGIYYETCFHHGEFWRMTTSASLACQALVMNHPGEPTQAHMDIIRRAFWHCSIMETYLELELGTPATGLDKYEGKVPVPNFGGGFSQEDLVSNQASHFQEHFASQIVLRRLSTDFNAVLNSVPATLTLNASTIMNKPALPGAIRSLAMQLDHWRETLLPKHLQWAEDNPESLPGPASRQAMFTTDLNAPPVPYRYAMDIQVALMRTRYYHTKHFIHRPFLYKALHHPDQMAPGDAEGVAACLRACLRWPLTMSPVCTRKRLIPSVFFWTQNLLGVLIILYLSEKVPLLYSIRTTLCGENFEFEAKETVALAVEWIRDLKEADAAAERAWDVVKKLYGLDD